MLKPVTRKATISQAEADRAVREYRSMHGIACRSPSGGSKRRASRAAPQTKVI